MIINSTVLSILSVKNSILIGILSGILNIIPYVGPLITLLIGLFLGVSGNIIDGHYELIGGTVVKIIFTLVTINILDGTVFQPYIFSNVLKAHPLEIFLVIISAGMLGGIVWMMLAIPVYVIIKVVFKEVMVYWKNWN
jgi:predicted PurR-regulated permease PerM